MDNTKNIIRTFILEELLPDEDPALLTDSTQLVTSGVLDSLATLQLVGFIQEQFDIEIEPHEMSLEYMDTLTDIVHLINSKR